ncbi:MAG: hypothetical protein ACJ8CZ_06170, partial [Microvirga sp.]
ATPPTGPETIAIDPSEPVHMKDLGGADSDRWNGHLISSLVAAIPGSHAPDQRNHIAQAVITGQMALKLTDPVEAMLSAQMIAANAAGLDLYRRAWIPEQSFEARTKYLALADKAARTVALLTEALDRHRGRGQQQITVKHVTVNADQAVVADQVVTGAQRAGGGDGSRKSNQPHALAHAPSTSLHSALEADGAAVPRSRR